MCWLTLNPVVWLSTGVPPHSCLPAIQLSHIHRRRATFLRALLSACGRCSFGVLFSSCACMSVPGVLLSVGVCVRVNC